ncbi:hypothetical protein [Cognatishimia activa]|uniref:COG3904 family protein n=1 Tax=Cognatishimia activa TaxID=1715691 RepID=UPI00222FF9F8|nr:hypothetical protein [Cognatishimia activa]UZD92515.1 hypothetical protein M0D42_07875 [Cognatishimia activa]
MSAITTDTVRQGPTFAGILWVQGVLLRLVISCCVAGLTFLQPLPLALVACVLATDLFSFMWALVRYNNVAGLHLQYTGRFWPVVFGYVFFFFAAIAMMLTWWLLIISTDTSSVLRHEPKSASSSPAALGERFVAEISRDRTQVIFKGVITQGLATQIEPTFEESNKIDTLVLNSAGGNVQEARRLAEDVARRGLDTHVTHECSASCLLVFMAGQNRTVGIGGQLGFHRYGLDFAQVQPHLSPLREMRIDQQFYLERGVSLDFVDEIFDLNRNAIWYPTRRELLSAGITTQ